VLVEGIDQESGQAETVLMRGDDGSYIILGYFEAVAVEIPGQARAEFKFFRYPVGADIAVQGKKVFGFFARQTARHSQVENPEIPGVINLSRRQALFKIDPEIIAPGPSWPGMVPAPPSAPGPAPSVQCRQKSVLEETYFKV